jgi:hypothetical protein
MTPEDLYWEDEMNAITQETISYYQQQKEVIHPLLQAVHPMDRKHMAHRINSAWSRVESFMGWEQFVKISSIYLEAEMNGDTEPDNLTENILAFVHFELEEIGVEVAKLRNGMRVKAQQATRDIRDKVMDMAIKENILEMESKEDIKLKIYHTIVA